MDKFLISLGIILLVIGIVKLFIALINKNK